jgi:hypothetical protein
VSVRAKGGAFFWVPELHECGSLLLTPEAWRALNSLRATDCPEQPVARRNRDLSSFARLTFRGGARLQAMIPPVTAVIRPPAP